MADDLNAIIDEHMPALDKPGVLSVRPGFKVKDGWLTDRRSVVVTVRKKLATPPAGEALPTEVAGVPVDVRQASPAKREEIEDPAGWAAQLRLSPDVGSVPHFADERTPAGFRPAAKASAHAQLAKIAKTKLDYSGPAGVTLAAIEAEAKISLSASPDTGWATLKEFLDGTRHSLVVGLYDFTSQHVLDAVKQAAQAKQLTLVLDHPPKNPTAEHNQPPEQAGPPLTPPGPGSSQTPPFQEFFPVGAVSAKVKIAPLLTPSSTSCRP